MRSIYTILLIVISCTLCRAQSGYLKIQETLILDSVVKREVALLVEQHIQEGDSLFIRGYGYINVYFNHLNRRRRSDTIGYYFISPCGSELRANEDDDWFPPFYTFTGKRPVLLFNDDLKDLIKLQYDHSSKKKLSKIITKFVDPKDVEEQMQATQELSIALRGTTRSKSAIRKSGGAKYTTWYLHGTEIFVLEGKKYIVNHNKH